MLKVDQWCNALMSIYVCDIMASYWRSLTVLWNVSRNVFFLCVCGYLMVPVGEGRGLMRWAMLSGMFMVRGEICGWTAFTGDSGSVFSRLMLARAVNVIFILVLGKRNVHLWERHNRISMVTDTMERAQTRTQTSTQVWDPKHEGGVSLRGVTLPLARDLHDTNNLVVRVETEHLRFN